MVSCLVTRSVFDALSLGEEGPATRSCYVGVRDRPLYPRYICVDLIAHNYTAQTHRAHKMKRMDEWVKTLLDLSDQEAIEEVSRCGGSKNGMSPGVKTLVGDSLSFVAEKAAQNVRGRVNWYQFMIMKRKNRHLL